VLAVGSEQRGSNDHASMPAPVDEEVVPFLMLPDGWM
jgi:hypothetical protein